MLTLIILPLHRAAYHVDMTSLTPLLVMMVQEIIVGIVLGATARVTLAALAVAGSVIAQQLGLGFVTSVDPTQGQQGALIGNFLTLLGTDAAVRDRHASPGDRRARRQLPHLHARRTDAHRRHGRAGHQGLSLGASGSASSSRRRSSCSDWCSTSGSGCCRALMPQMQVYFVGMPLSIFAGLLILIVVLATMMATFLDYFGGVMHQLSP